MATTSDLSPAARKAAAKVNELESTEREARLEEQVEQLQNDLKEIAATLARIGKSEAKQLQRKGEQVVEDVQDQASAVEKQLKDTIREKPLTAVASALGIGFILALLTR